MLLPGRHDDRLRPWRDRKQAAGLADDHHDQRNSELRLWIRSFAVRQQDNDVGPVLAVQRVLDADPHVRAAAAVDAAQRHLRPVLLAGLDLGVTSVTTRLSPRQPTLRAIASISLRHTATSATLIEPDVSTMASIEGVGATQPGFTSLRPSPPPRGRRIALSRRRDRRWWDWSTCPAAQATACRTCAANNRCQGVGDGLRSVSASSTMLLGQSPAT